MMRFWIFSLLSMFLIFPASAQELTPFFMTFVPNVQFAQMYVGIEKGYFAEAGYDFVLEYGDEPDGVNLIAAGERDFGLIAGEQVILARANGRPVVSVYEWWQRYPIGIVTSVDSGIETPADLAGRTVGLPGRFGATYSGLVALLNAGDLSESDVQLQEIGFNAPEVICVGGVEASAVYINNEPLQIQQRAEAGDCGDIKAVRVIPVADYADLVSNGLVTNETLVAERPERLAAMVSAYDRAVNDVIQNPAEAYLLSEPHIENLPLSDEFRIALEGAAEEQATFLETDPTPAAITESRGALREMLEAQFPADELLQMTVLLETVALWEAEVTGLADIESWQRTQDTLLAMGFLTDEIDLEDAFTNEFLPESIR